MTSKKTFLLASAVSLFAVSAFAQFTPGNLAVLRVGDGTQTIANTGNTIFIDEYTISGGLVNSIQLPDSGANALVLSGTATAEGFLALSADRQYLTLAGYNTPRPYTLSTGDGSTVGARGLAVDFSGTEAVIFATTAETSAGG